MARPARRTPRRSRWCMASNFSVGIPALQLLLACWRETLPAGLHAEQVETHHRHKLDRPSGTARWLARAWRATGGGEAPFRPTRCASAG